MVFQWSCMDVRVGLWRKMSTEELMLLNCGVGEDSLESLDCKEIQPVHSKGDQPWVLFGRNDAKAETLATSLEELTQWKILWCWEGLEAVGEGDDRGWDGWMTSLIDGREFEWIPGVGDGQGGLACCDSPGRQESDITERLNWTELNCAFYEKNTVTEKNKCSVYIIIIFTKNRL